MHLSNLESGHLNNCIIHVHVYTQVVNIGIWAFASCIDCDMKPYLENSLEKFWAVIKLKGGPFHL